MKGLLFILLLAAFAQADVIVLSSDNAADISAAEAAAGMSNATLINSSWGERDLDAVEMVKALSPSKVVVIGGNLAVPEEILAKLKSAGIETARVSGADRYETAAEVAYYFWKNAPEVLMVEGTDKEAMKEARIEAKEKGIPIVFMEKGTVRESVNERLELLNVSQVNARLAPDTDKRELEKAIVLAQLTIKEVDKEKRALIEIEEAGLLLEQAKKHIDVSKGTDAAGIAASELLVIAEESLERAKEAYEYGDHGEAYGHAMSSGSISQAAIRVHKRITAGWYGSQVEKVEARIIESGMEEVRQEIIENRERIMVCPQYVSPSPEWYERCKEKGGTVVVGGIDLNGCKMPPKCMLEEKCPGERPEVCTQEYSPVCARIEERDAAGRATILYETYSNGCMACAKSTKMRMVMGYTKGACAEDIRTTEPYNPDDVKIVEPYNPDDATKTVEKPITGTGTVVKPITSETHVCTDPRPEMCTEEYSPVCGKIKEVDSTGLARIVYNTYSNGCHACADPKVWEYSKGACVVAVSVSGGVAVSEAVAE